MNSKPFPISRNGKSSNEFHASFQDCNLARQVFKGVGYLHVEAASIRMTKTSSCTSEIPLRIHKCRLDCNPHGAGVRYCRHNSTSMRPCKVVGTSPFVLIFDFASHFSKLLSSFIALPGDICSDAFPIISLHRQHIDCAGSFGSPGTPCSSRALRRECELLEATIKAQASCLERNGCCSLSLGSLVRFPDIKSSHVGRARSNDRTVRRFI